MLLLLRWSHVIECIPFQMPDRLHYRLQVVTAGVDARGGLLLLRRCQFTARQVRQTIIADDDRRRGINAFDLDLWFGFDRRFQDR